MKYFRHSNLGWIKLHAQSTLETPITSNENVTQDINLSPPYPPSPLPCMSPFPNTRPEPSHSPRTVKLTHLVAKGRNHKLLSSPNISTKLLKAPKLKPFLSCIHVWFSRNMEARNDSGDTRTRKIIRWVVHGDENTNMISVERVEENVQTWVRMT